MQTLEKQTRLPHPFYDVELPGSDTQSEEIRDFTRSHPPLAQTLRDAVPQIERFFGPGAAVSVRISGDQESAPYLSVNIKTPLEMSAARAARKLFHASEWMRHVDAQEFPLTFNLDFE